MKEMKNILIITPFYPLHVDKKLKNDTKVVSYLCQECPSDVNIIIAYYYQHTRFEALKQFAICLVNKHYQHYIHHDDCGRTVFLFEHPCIIPKRYRTLSFFNRRYVSKINDYFLENNINLDAVVVHFPIMFDDFVRRISCATKIAIVHSMDVKDEEKKKELRYTIGNYSKIGCRSFVIRQKISDMIRTKKVFDCYSGIPESMLAIDRTSKKWKENRCLKLVYVGRLDKNKNVLLTLQTLALLHDKLDFSFTVVGDGNMRSKLERFVVESNLQGKVHFVGQLMRSEAFNQMVVSDVFVMVSHKETLGLTYLEAVAAGCVVIGSKGQGIDGILKNGESAFFVSDTSTSDLAKKLIEISELPEDKVVEIKRCAFEVVSKMSDKSMSQNYISNIVDEVESNA